MAELRAQCDQASMLAKETAERANEIRDTYTSGSRNQGCSSIEYLDPLCTERQKLMALYHDTLGVKGLAHMIVELIKRDVSERQARRQQRSDDRSSQLDLEELCLIDSDADSNLGDVGDVLEKIEENQAEAARVVDGLAWADVWPSQEEKKDGSPISSHAPGSDKQKRKQVDAYSTSSPRPHSSPSNEQSLKGPQNSILEDWDNGGSKLLRYVGSVQEEIISALIRGNLPSQLQDQGFTARNFPHVGTADEQGTYVVYTSMRQLLNSTPESIGKGMTLRQLGNVVEKMELYINVDKAGSADYAREVGVQFSGASEIHEGLDYTTQRRYASGKNHSQFHHHEKWISSIRKVYVERVSEANEVDSKDILDVPLSRCLGFVGGGQCVIRESQNQSNHVGYISPVLGLLCAILKKEYGDLFGTSCSTYQVFSTMDKCDIGFDEEPTKVLCSGYLRDGGLSLAHADAGDPVQRRKACDDGVWFTNRMAEVMKDTVESKTLRENLEKSDRMLRGVSEELQSALQLDESVIQRLLSMRP